MRLLADHRSHWMLDHNNFKLYWINSCLKRIKKCTISSTRPRKSNASYKLFSNKLVSSLSKIPSM